MSARENTSQTGQFGKRRRSAGDRWLHAALLVTVMLAGAVAMSANAADPDLWGHVQYGRDLLRYGLPETTTYSFTAEGYRWINHENLSEVLLALGADTLGPAGLLMAKCLLGCGLLGLILWQARQRGVRPLALGFLLLLIATNLAAHWSLRPQLMSYTGYALLLALLAWCFRDWEAVLGRGRKQAVQDGDTGTFAPRDAQPAAGQVASGQRLKYLWLAPPLFLIWANAHGGFVAGYCIFAAYLGLRACEAIWSRRWAARGLVLRLLCMVLASGLATLINPYGPNLHGWLLRALSVPRPEITEWHPIRWASAEGLSLLLLIATTCIALALTRRRRDLTHLILLGLIFWQTLAHARHVPFLAVAVGFWLPVHLDSVFRRLRLGRQVVERGGNRESRVGWSLLAGLCVASGLLSMTLAGRVSQMPVHCDQYPVAAVQYMADQQLRGKLVVTYNWAQYLIAAFGQPEGDPGGVRVAFDGRFRTCYPQEVVDMHFDLVLGDLGRKFRYRSPKSPPFDPTRALEHGGPNLVLINRFQPHSERLLRSCQDAWVLLYQDKVAQLWGRRSVYDDPAQLTYVPPRQREISEQPQTGSVNWPALPRQTHHLQLAATAAD